MQARGAFKETTPEILDITVEIVETFLGCKNKKLSLPNKMQYLLTYSFFVLAVKYFKAPVRHNKEKMCLELAILMINFESQFINRTFIASYNYILLKRLIATLLLSVHLFNLGGYSLLYQYFINQADVQMIKQVYDNKIDDTKLIELKIPVHMPTISDWNEYEVVAGQIQLNDAYYNYLKLKMTRDTMYFICFADTVKTRLVKANVICAKEISDVPISKKGDTPVKKAGSPNEYNLQDFIYEYTVVGIFIKPQYNIESSRLNRPYISSPGKPPNSNS